MKKEIFLNNFKITIGDGWEEFFINELRKEYFKDLLQKVEEEYLSKVIYPEKKDVFNVFSSDLNLIKYVLLGQDPYHSKGMANGYAFSVNRDSKKIPPSLRNIMLEYSHDLHKNLSYDLKELRESGWFLMNKIFTVEEGKPLSHEGLGWNKFTKNVLEFLVEKQNPVFLVLGRKAESEILKIKNIDLNKLVIRSHPSGFSCRNNFLGTKPFSEITKLT